MAQTYLQTFKFPTGELQLLWHNLTYATHTNIQTYKQLLISMRVLQVARLLRGTIAYCNIGVNEEKQQHNNKYKCPKIQKHKQIMRQRLVCIIWFTPNTKQQQQQKHNNVGIKKSASAQQQKSWVKCTHAAASKSPLPPPHSAGRSPLKMSWMDAEALRALWSAFYFCFAWALLNCQPATCNMQLGDSLFANASLKQ